MDAPSPFWGFKWPLGSNGFQPVRNTYELPVQFNLSGLDATNISSRVFSVFCIPSNKADCNGWSFPLEDLQSIQTH